MGIDISGGGEAHFETVFDEARRGARGLARLIDSYTERVLPSCDLFGR
jgi:hypothetical protein